MEMNRSKHKPDHWPVCTACGSSNIVFHHNTTRYNRINQNFQLVSTNSKWASCNNPDCLHQQFEPEWKEVEPHEGLETRADKTL
jgi:hypothetical protein